MIIDTLDGLLRILIVGPLAYGLLIVILRTSGKRTLSKMNAFDFVVTVALGSTLATVLLSKDVPLIEGVLGFVVLAILQFIISWLARRRPWFEAIVKAEPRILFRDGIFVPRALSDERVTEEEVRSAIRGSGIGDLRSVAAVVLETNGRFSVISLDAAGDRSALPKNYRQI